jgi:hypothetical protein
MVALLLTTTISCTDGFKILNRITSVIGLTPQQKVEIVQTLREYIPSCPVKIVKPNK